MDTDTGIKGAEELQSYIKLISDGTITINEDVITIPADKGIEEEPFIKLAKEGGFIIQYRMF